MLWLLLMWNQTLLPFSNLFFKSAYIVFLDVFFVFYLLDFFFSLFNLLPKLLDFSILFNQESQSFGLDLFDFVLEDLLIGLFFNDESSLFIFKFGNFLHLFLEFLPEIVFLSLVGLDFSLIIFESLLIFIFPIDIELLEFFPKLDVL